MDNSVHSSLVSFIWSIADDCLRDIYVRGKYRDVILPMVVLRRIDSLLEETKDKVLEEVRFQEEDMGFTNFDISGLKQASGYVFYNTSKWTLQNLFNTATNSQQLLESNFTDYINGFSDNVKEIVKCFKLKEQIHHMATKDILYDVLEKFTSPWINLTNKVKLDPDGRTLHALSNLGMGYVFEELIRRFNEENNEEAGEHFTPREVIELMTHLIFEPIKDNIPQPVTIYDPACGSGGMLTESQDFIMSKYPDVSSEYLFLYGKEINDETYAICKSDMMIKGNNPENIRSGSTLAKDEFSGESFNFMLSNPPYGKSWATDSKYIKNGKEVIDPRFQIQLSNYWNQNNIEDAIPRSSDGQLLFLMEMVDKMKPVKENIIGSRIASVHNGSSLFTGDAGGGESNIRRYIIENDYLEAIIQMPNNLFYNTGISTYIWLLSNNKAKNRRGKVQLIDASDLYEKLRKNLGHKNCELKTHHIDLIMDCYNEMKHIEKNNENKIGSQVFDNSDFGYNKITIERPKRLSVQFTDEAVESLRYDKSLLSPMKFAYEKWGENIYNVLKDKEVEKEIIKYCEDIDFELTTKLQSTLLSSIIWDKHKEIRNTALYLMGAIGKDVFMDYNEFIVIFDSAIKKGKIKLSTSNRNIILNSISTYNEESPKVVKKIHKINAEGLKELTDYLSCNEEDLPNYGYYSTEKKGVYIEYETESDLRDFENVPLKESVYEYFLREVKPHYEEAWINLSLTKIGYEISFNKYFYRHKPLRTIEEISLDIIELEKQSEGLINEIIKF